jgi:DNA polymerase-4
VTARRLHDLGVTTVGEVAAFAENDLVSVLGRASGRHLYALARNRDPRPVRGGTRRGSIGAQRALGRSPKSFDDVSASLVGLVERVTRRMRVAGRSGRTVVLRLRFDDFSRATRSQTLRHPTANTGVILATAAALLEDAVPLIEERGITLVGVAVGNLGDGTVSQLALPFDRRHSDALDEALDEVWQRFGSQALTRAVLLGRRRGVEMPLLPD